MAFAGAKLADLILGCLSGDCNAFAKVSVIFWSLDMAAGDSELI